MSFVIINCRPLSSCLFCECCGVISFVEKWVHYALILWLINKNKEVGMLCIAALYIACSTFPHISKHKFYWHCILSEIVQGDDALSIPECVHPGVDCQVTWLASRRDRNYDIQHGLCRFWWLL